MATVRQFETSVPAEGARDGWPVPDPRQVLVRYDRARDTLMVHFDGVARPAVSLDKDGGWYVRWSRELHRPVGVQIEEFLAEAVTAHPGLLDALAVAELSGITADEVAGLRREAGVPIEHEARDGFAQLVPRLWHFATDGTGPARQSA